MVPDPSKLIRDEEAEKNWSTNTSSNDDVTSAGAIKAKGSERLGNYLRLTQPNMTRKMHLIVKKLQDEEALSSRLMQSNREKRCQNCKSYHPYSKHGTVQHPKQQV